MYSSLLAKILYQVSTALPRIQYIVLSIDALGGSRVLKLNYLTVALKRKDYVRYTRLDNCLISLLPHPLCI